MASLIPARDDLGVRSGYHSPQVDVAVRLNTNESPFPPPAGWVNELRDAIASLAFERYPERGASELRAALAELHGVRADQVFCANGSNEVLQTLLLAYGGPGRRAAVFEPTYALHSLIARHTATEVAVGPRRPDFTLDLDAVAAAPADITFVCSPNNPTGRAEPREVVEKVLELAPGLVVVDEAYGQFSPWSALTLVDDDDGVLVVRTFSKTWAMAGVRLGYLVGPAALVAELDRVVLPYHLSVLTQAAGRLALKYRPEMEARVATIVEERGRLAAALADLPVESWPSDANFILFRPVKRNGAEVWQALVDRSVLVRDCGSWPGLDGCLRVTVGTPDENGAFLAALKEVLA
ncbi:MAG TPA: histidinol-phosphate transaminase [Acidimicrobiales bacterium]|nr:histidinol-phosphate transaminase [Acidimicrobiales bacterium]